MTLVLYDVWCAILNDTRDLSRGMAATPLQQNNHCSPQGCFQAKALLKKKTAVRSNIHSIQCFCWLPATLS